ncbi:MAG: hypothetical protein LBQ54_05640 [Planctomycetaceae bacterium]|jgi:ribonuclease HII|nr:hypothetical protein [Planctomycetaceae bacterium]
MKHYIIGTDEAGYGPNLGPFVVSCTCWELADSHSHTGQHHAGQQDGLTLLQQRLADVVTDVPRELGRKNYQIVIGDSKKLYTASKPLETLRKTVFHTLAILGMSPADWRELVQILAPEDVAAVFRDYASDKTFAPEETSFPTDCLEKNGVFLRKIRSRIITPEVFNLMLDRFGNKSQLLTEWTLGLLREQMSEIPKGRITVICDKHGGRNRYLDILSHWFPDHLIEIVTESRENSVYRFSTSDLQAVFQFRAKADQFIPTGLASIVSKYLRETAMEIFNGFWKRHLPDLKPTAGYPIDAVRFFRQIRGKAEQLGISETSLWRNK